MIVDAAVYQDGVRRADLTDLDALWEACGGPDTFAWIGLHDPTEEEFERVRHEFGLHELAVEDAATGHQRPKLEAYGDSLFVVLRTARYDDANERVDVGEIDIFCGHDFLVAVRRGNPAGLATVRHTLEADPERLAMGPVAVLHAIADRVVEDYRPVVLGLDNDIAEVEQEVFSDSRVQPTERIYFLKREVLAFQRACSPLLDVLGRITTNPVLGVPAGLRDYFRDVQDELTRVVDQTTTHRELLTSVLEANLTQVSIRQNEDMRAISAWVAIAVVPTAVGGLYGMNVDGLPFADDTWSFASIAALTAALCALLWWRLRRAGWL